MEHPGTGCHRSPCRQDIVKQQEMTSGNRSPRLRHEGMLQDTAPLVRLQRIERTGGGLPSQQALRRQIPGSQESIKYGLHLIEAAFPFPRRMQRHRHRSLKIRRQMNILLHMTKIRIDIRQCTAPAPVFEIMDQAAQAAAIDAKRPGRTDDSF